RPGRLLGVRSITIRSFFYEGAMATKVSTLNKIDIAILEPHGSLVGDSRTDELRAKSHDLFEQGNRKLVIDLGGISYQ
ncbi:MAG TPA: hypothetical protein VIH68_00105, partial [Bacteroidota bacterium]